MRQTYSREEVTVMLCALYDEVLDRDSDDADQRDVTIDFVSRFMRDCDELLPEAQKLVAFGRKETAHAAR